MQNNQKSPPITDLTLRDLFAALAAGHIWASMEIATDSLTAAEAAAQTAYLVADELLKERGYESPKWERR